MPVGTLALALLAGCADDGIRHVRVVQAPGNPLGCIVSFETDQRATAEVRFGHAGHRWRIPSTETGTKHEILVIGLRPEGSYDLTLRAETTGGRVLERNVDWKTNPVPAPARAFEVTGLDPGGAQPGWTLLDLQTDGRLPTAVMVDDEGWPVWMYQIDEDDDERPGVLDVSFTHRQTVLIGGAIPQGGHPVEVDLAGQVLWQGPAQVGFEKDGYLHHHLEMLPNGDLLAIEKTFQDELRGDVVFAMRPNGDRVWSWNTFDHLPPPTDTGETHANWAQVDGDRVLVSLAALGQIASFDLATGDLHWVLGRRGDFTLAGNNKWFNWQHAPYVLPDGNLLVYDNSGLSDRSRVVEYALDETARVATQVWSWDGAPDNTWKATAYGSVEPQPNGNLLISAGGTIERHRLMEIDEEERVVWEMELKGVAVYRARRIVPPLIEPLD